jgi:hypothetical protein
MRIQMNAYSDEMGIPSQGHPLSDYHFNVFIWRYQPNEMNPHVDQGATLSVNSLRKRRNGEGKAISMDSVPFKSQQALEEACAAMDELNGEAMWAVVQSMMPKPRAPKDRKTSKAKRSKSSE